MYKNLQAFDSQRASACGLGNLTVVLKRLFVFAAALKTEKRKAELLV